MWRVVLLGIAAVLLIACGDTPSTGSTGSTGSAGATKALTLVGDPQVTRLTAASIMVAGRVKNEAARPYSGAVVVTLFDDAGKIVGTCNGAVNNVPAGEEMPYQAVGRVDAAVTWAKVEPKITSQIPR